MYSLKQKNAGAPKKQRLSSQVPHKLADIDKVSVVKGCADRKTCCRSQMYKFVREYKKKWKA